MFSLTIFFASFVFTTTAYACYDSYKDHQLLLNQRVVGKLIGNESALERVSSGKGQTRLASVLYVFYQIDGGVVSFPRGSGIIYPEQAIFYRNPR